VDWGGAPRRWGDGVAQQLGGPLRRVVGLDRSGQDGEAVGPPAWRAAALGGDACAPAPSALLVAVPLPT